jgi:alanine dehydrogenase
MLWRLKGDVSLGRFLKMYLKKETKDGETISDYESSGAKIVDKFSAFQSDIVLKVRSPTMNEVGLFREQVSF